MAMERKWAARPSQPFTANGTADGHITVADSRPFKVKQIVKLLSDTVQPTFLQVKRVNSLNDIELGPVTQDINARSDVSTFLVSDNASILAQFQDRPTISWEDLRRAVYEEEPTVALRTFPVDELGNSYTTDNPFPVDATINVDHLNVDIENPGAPTIINIEVDDADTEQSYSFPVDTKRFRMKVRGGDAKIRISYEAGQSGTQFFTNEMGNIYESGDIDPNYPLIIYFQLSKGSKIVEIESWANL